MLFDKYRRFEGRSWYIFKVCEWGTVREKILR